MPCYTANLVHHELAYRSKISYTPLSPIPNTPSVEWTQFKKKIQGVTPPGPIYEYVGAVARDGIDSTTVGFLDLENRGSRWNFLPLCHGTRDISGVCSV